MHLSAAVVEAAAPGPAGYDLRVAVELTPAQARAIAELAEREGVVSLHQLSHDTELAGSADVFATPHGTDRGYRVNADGQLVEIGKTLPGL